MHDEIDAVNHILPNVNAGDIWDWNEEEDDYEDSGEKAAAIRVWIRSVVGKINDYKARHRRILDEDVAPTLQQILPQDIVRNSVLPFLKLPPNAFE